MNPRFKEQLFKDMDVFINMDEFASLHNINGVDMYCIIDEDLFEERGQTQAESNFNGVYLKTKSIFIRKEDIYKPEVDERFDIDGRHYLVRDVIETEHLYEIQVQRRDY